MANNAVGVEQNPDEGYPRENIHSMHGYPTETFDFQFDSYRYEGRELKSDADSFSIMQTVALP